MSAANRRGLDRDGCSRRWRPARRATRSTARSGIWPPSTPAGPYTSLLGLPAPKPVTTAYTISLATPEAMAQAAAGAAGRGAAQGQARRRWRYRARIAAVRRAAPNAELIVDANEGWTPQDLADNLAACAQAGVTLVEQPLPDEPTMRSRTRARPVPICADESVHARASLAALVGKYDAVNIKLDKTGGLTEALAMAGEAERLGLHADGRLHGGDLAGDGAGDAASRSARASSISTGRCCSRATGRTGCATRRAECTRPRPRCGDERRTRART